MILSFTAPRFCAPEADLRTDIPRYRVFENGRIIDEPYDIQQYWDKNSVAFLLGCSTNFDYILRKSNVQYRYIGDHTTLRIDAPLFCDLGVSEVPSLY